ncbi:EsaB/YukD family protein [Nocardioides immobilis]|uniref:EsaB/YukD family protein n=1 Tax=Nocardioides immobilis TaxID=2049295 RepID=UPI001FEB7A90|nr:EsaB/YukD family protein [Nocardioides immobilis]
MSERLLRVTAVAGGRRSDLAVPGGVAVAELVPDLARAVGLLDPAAVYAGYRLHAQGRRLRPDQGLREQGVDDGALLAVAARADEGQPAVHDDLAEATAEAVARVRPWRPADTRRTTCATGLLGLAVGLGALAWDLVPRVTTGWSVVLVLAVLAGNALPALAVAVGVGRADGTPADPDRVEALVVRSTRLLLVGSVVVGLVAVVTVPVVADGTAGAALAVDCCLVLLLRAPRHRSLTQVLVDAAGGLAGLLVIVVAVLLRHPDARPVLAGTLVLAGLVTCGVTRLPPVPAILRARAIDLVETLALVALAPLLLVATHGLARITGG